MNFLYIGIVHKILSFKTHSSDLGSFVYKFKESKLVKLSGLPEIRMLAGNPALTM